MLLACCTAQPKTATESAIPQIADRVAGPPQRCVPIEQSRGLHAAGPRTLLYGSGRTIWVNRLPEDCAGIRFSDILVIEPSGSQYCQGDFLRTRDNVTLLPGPGCRLNDFVPYRKP
jgi:hypothetical protein